MSAGERPTPWWRRILTPGTAEVGSPKNSHPALGRAQTVPIPGRREPEDGDAKGGEKPTRQRRQGRRFTDASLQSELAATDPFEEAQVDEAAEAELAAIAAAEAPEAPACAGPSKEPSHDARGLQQKALAALVRALASGELAEALGKPRAVAQDIHSSLAEVQRGLSVVLINSLYTGKLQDELARLAPQCEDPQAATERPEPVLEEAPGGQELLPSPTVAAEDPQAAAERPEPVREEAPGGQELLPSPAVAAEEPDIEASPNHACGQELIEELEQARVTEARLRRTIQGLEAQLTVANQAAHHYRVKFADTDEIYGPLTLQREDALPDKIANPSVNTAKQHDDTEPGQAPQPRPSSFWEHFCCSRGAPVHPQPPALPGRDRTDSVAEFLQLAGARPS